MWDHNFTSKGFGFLGKSVFYNRCCHIKYSIFKSHLTLMSHPAAKMTLSLLFYPLYTKIHGRWQHVFFHLLSFLTNVTLHSMKHEFSFLWQQLHHAHLLCRYLHLYFDRYIGDSAFLIQINIVQETVFRCQGWRIINVSNSNDSLTVTL